MGKKNHSELFENRLTENLALAIVIPAFNEELRLPATLLKAVDYLETNKARLGSYEILVVDDGSTDNTCEVVEQFSKLNPQVFWLSLPCNMGKGQAVKYGMQQALGKSILFMDADGATPFQEIERLLNAIQQGADLAFGSRALSDQDTSVKTVWYRKIMGRVFNLLVNILLLPNVRDTQCGFKIFTKEAARELFEKQTLPGFGFDVEILYLARRLGLKSREVAVNWVNIPGSKVRVIQHSVKMFAELLTIKLRHAKVTRSLVVNKLTNSQTIDH